MATSVRILRRQHWALNEGCSRLIDPHHNQKRKVRGRVEEREGWRVREVMERGERVAAEGPEPTQTQECGVHHLQTTQRETRPGYFLRSSNKTLQCNCTRLNSTRSPRELQGWCTGTPSEAHGEVSMVLCRLALSNCYLKQATFRGRDPQQTDP